MKQNTFCPVKYLVKWAEKRSKGRRTQISPHAFVRVIPFSSTSAVSPSSLWSAQETEWQRNPQMVPKHLDRKSLIKIIQQVTVQCVFGVPDAVFGVLHESQGYFGSMLMTVNSVCRWTQQNGGYHIVLLGISPPHRYVLFMHSFSEGEKQVIFNLQYGFSGSRENWKLGGLSSQSN